jgi:four helix bundle protein
MDSIFTFRFERLDVYRLSLAVARWMRKVKWPTVMAPLKDQGIRAADSMVLNIAVGSARGGKAGQNHYRIAQGSAGEALAVLDISALTNCSEQQQRLRRVAAMLQRMRAMS